MKVTLSSLYTLIQRIYLFLMATNAVVFLDDLESIKPERANKLRNKIIDDVNNKVPEGESQKFKDYGRHTSSLPPLQRMPGDFRAIFLQKLQDEDMKDDLQTHHVINWCKATKKLYPIKTKADGNCLLHSISMYVWGVDDRHSFLRRLLYLNLATDTKGRYKQRWKFSQMMSSDFQEANARFETADIEGEWETIIQETADITQTGSNGLPYFTLQSVHLYVLANTFQRPIFVLADRVARNVFGQSLQENHIGGIYLPLEWSPGLCHKHPIVIGYNMNHFVPLLMEAGIQLGIEQSVPIVSHELLSLGIKFLLPGEDKECTKLLQDYLDITEVAHKGVNIPVARVLHKALPEKYDMIDIYREDCEAKFRQLIDQEAGIIVANPNPPQQQPFRFEVNKKPGLQENGYITNENKPSNAVNVSGQNVLHVQKKRKKEPKKCLTMGCEMFGNPETRNLCSKCFSEFTVYYSKQEEAQRHLQPKQRPRSGKPPAAAAVREYHDLSMMGEDCKCGFKCSTETYPYCHECYPGHHDKHGQPQPPVPAPQPAPTRSDLSILPDTCKGVSCTFQCSKATYPYCHECYNKNSPQLQEPTAPPLMEPVDAIPADHNLQLRIGSSAEQTGRQTENVRNKLLPSQPTAFKPEEITTGQSSGELLKKCKTETCTNRAVKGNDGACDTCYKQMFFGSGSVASSPPDEAILNDIRILNKDKCCINTNCNEEVHQSTSQCLSCFLRGDIEKPTKKDKKSSNTEKSLTMNISIPETKEESKILNSKAEEEEFSLLTPQAQLNDLHLLAQSGANNTPIVPSDPSLPEMPPLSPLSPSNESEPSYSAHRKYLCSSAGCEGIRNDNGYCYTCTKRMGQRTPLEGVKHLSLSGAVVTNPSGEAEQVSHLEMSCTPVTLSEEQKKELNPLITSSRQKVQCASSTCSNLIYPPSKLCGECDGILKSKQAQKSMEENIKSVQGTPVPCKTPGCQFFGMPETGNLCSSCFKSGVHRHTAPLQTQKRPDSTKKHVTAPLHPIVKPSGKPCIVPGCTRFGDPAQADRCSQHYEEAMAKLPPKMSDQSIARYKNGPTPEKKRSKSTNQNVAFHRPHTVGSFPTTRQDVDPLVVAMGKVESSRKSNVLCKNNATRGCQNYGNSKNKGYCNTCFPEVLRLESGSRPIGLVGQNQFG